MTALALIAVLAAPSAQSSCDALRAQAEAVKGDSQQLVEVYDRSIDCGAGFSDALGLWVARAMLRDAQQLISEGDLAAATQTLQRSLSYGRVWQSLATLGDLLTEERAHDGAARYYQECLDLINDAASTHTPPDVDTIGALFRKAERARLLARNYVTTVNRSTGEPGGLALTSVRGFVPESVSLPITFEFDSTVFTPKGRTAAEDLLTTLQSQQPPAVELIGHADPRGEEAYNQRLSERRAAAVKLFLAENGYRGAVKTSGRGESDPPEIDDPEAYTQEELYQLRRRVELVRLGTP